MVRRIALVIGVVTLAIAGMSLPAWAHVTVAPESAPSGANDQQITFRVPNEESSAATTKIDIALPTNPPLIGVLALPVTGWTVKVTTQHLATPIQTDDGPVQDVVNDVTWTAASTASGVQVNNFGAFQILIGALPKGTQVVFKAVQTYSNGNIVRWIDPVTPNGPPADHPTPILTLTSGSSSGSTTPTTTATSGSGTSGTATGAVKTAKDDASTAKTIGVIAIILALIAIAVGVLALVMRRRPESV